MPIHVIAHDGLSEIDIEPRIREIIREEIALAQPTRRRLTIDETKIAVNQITAQSPAASAPG